MYKETGSRIWVSQEAINDAVGCRKKNACLSCDYDSICKVVSTINDEIIFVNSCHDPDCPFQKQTKARIVCRCPVRKEILVRYGI